MVSGRQTAFFVFSYFRDYLILLLENLVFWLAILGGMKVIKILLPFFCAFAAWRLCE